MNLDIIFDASLAIQIHVCAAILSAIIGALVLWRRKGTASHKRLGKVWVALMVVTAMSSFLIHEIRLIGWFSPIHILSVTTLIVLSRGVKQAKAGEINAHKRSMKGTYIGAIGIAGLFTFLPGRMMYRVVIEPVIDSGLWMF